MCPDHAESPQGASEYIPPGVRNGLEKRSYASTAYARNISASALRRFTSPGLVLPPAFTWSLSRRRISSVLPFAAAEPEMMPWLIINSVYKVKRKTGVFSPKGMYYAACNDADARLSI